MVLEEYDSYAIKSYSFAVQKTNTFFSLPTVLLSFAILVASLLLNFNTLSHLWIPFQELEVLSSKSLEMP